MTKRSPGQKGSARSSRSQRPDWVRFAIVVILYRADHRQIYARALVDSSRWAVTGTCSTNVYGSIALSPPANLGRTWGLILHNGGVRFVPLFRTKSSTKRLFNHLGRRIIMSWHR